MNNKVEKVLVVGGAGYIGGEVTNVLLQKKIAFAVYDRLLYESQYLKPVEFIFGDIRDTDKLAKILPNFSHIIWLAAIVGDAACQIKPGLTIAVNQDSVRWLADNYEGRIIFLSTCSVYGEHDKIAGENSSVKPLSLYAQTKIEAEKYLKNKNALILRLGTVFGISDVYSRLRMDLVVNYMTARALTQGEIQVFGGEQWRPLIHVKDVAKVIVDNLEKEIKGVYNIATVNLQIKDLGKIVSRLTGCDVERIGQKFEDQRNYRVSTEKAIKDGVLSLERVYDVEHGVKEIMELIKSGRVKYTDNDIYFNERHIANLLEKGELQ